MEDMKNFSPLYPYNGRALNLIDKFYIFGYNYATLKKYLIDKTPKISSINFDEKSKTLPTFRIELGPKEFLEPTILSEITYDYNKELISPETCKELIFPNGLNFCYRVKLKKNYNPNLEKEEFNKIDLSLNTDDCPRGFKSAFSNTPLEGVNGRKSQYAFAYTFYRPFWKSKEIEEGKIFIFYIPYTFCIISEFPFYIGFQKLFKVIRSLFAQKYKYIPIEILLYQIVSLTPSPLNTDVLLDLNLMCNQQELFSKDKNKQNIIFKRSISEYKRSDIEKIFDNEDRINFTSLNNILPAKQQKEEDKSLENVIIFRYLSGYPLVEYNLIKVLFMTLSIDKIIKAFLFTFLEQEIIFFSEDIEYLSLTINSYANFNFPLNDCQYFYMVCAASLQEFQSGPSEIGEKSYSSIIGINNKYIKNYLSDLNKIKNHVVVDLDNGEIFIAIMNKKDDIIKKMNELITDLIEDNYSCKHLKETYLYLAIKNLKNRLSQIYKEYYENKNFKYMNYIELNNKTFLNEYTKANQSLQEAFYECVLTLSFYFYDNIIIMEENNKNNNSLNVEFNKKFEEENKFKTEEILIIKELLDSMKLKGSFMQFVRENDPIDLFKIPLTFSDEFISFFSKKKSELGSKNIKYFDIIDKLYISKKSRGIKIIDFKNEMIKYFNNFKKEFDREIKDSGIKRFQYDFSSLIKIENIKKERLIEYQTYELDDKILLKYIYKINSLSSEEKNFKKENIIKEISMSEVESIIEDFCINNGYLSEYDFFCGNIIILFSLSLKYFPENFGCGCCLKVLLNNFIIFRKYIYILLQILYELYIKSLQEKNYNFAEKIQFSFYFCLNHIRTQKLFPNENLMYIINKFLKSVSEEENNNNNIKENEIKEENNLINIECNFGFNPENLIIMNNSYNISFDKKGQKKNKDKRKLSANNLDLKDKNSKIRYNVDKNKIIESKYLKQKDIFNNLTCEYNIYIKLLDLNVLDDKKIIDSCLNIFLYLIENEKNKLFNEFDELIKIMENIFYIFIKSK